MSWGDAMGVNSSRIRIPDPGPAWSPARDLPSTPWAVLLLLLAACAPLRPAPHPSPAAVGLADSDSLRVENVAPGVRYLFAWRAQGPWAIHVVEVDDRICHPRLAALKAGPPLSARALTSTLGATALAAVNGDFFALPAGTPVEAQAHAGEVLVGPSDRPVFSVSAAGYRAGDVVIQGYAAVRGDTARIVQVNRPLAGDRHHPPQGGAMFFTHWIGARTPVDSTGVSPRTVAVRVLQEDARAGIGVVMAVADSAMPLAAGQMVAVQGRGPARSWVERRVMGDTVRWHVALVAANGTGARASLVPTATAPGRTAPSAAGDHMVAAGNDVVEEAVGGFPLLVGGGHSILDQQTGIIPSFGPARHPRTAVGWTADDRRLVLAVVDGRQRPYSDGMSLAELTWLMLRLGVTDAINMDGGGSSAMVVRGHVVNRPSDAEGERAVGNILALLGCG